MVRLRIYSEIKQRRSDLTISETHTVTELLRSQTSLLITILGADS